jgi:hypothetical protein
MMACGTHNEICDPANPSNVLYKTLWLYIVAPLCGGVLAGTVHKYHLVSFNEIAVWNGDPENKKSKLLE